MATKRPVAPEFTKKAVKAASRTDPEAGIEYGAELFSTEDENEGAATLLEDRDAAWQGK